jgi:TonB family protein
MTPILRSTLLAALAAAFIPAVAAGQDTSTVSLLHRIELLERANTDLEQRVRELESLIKSEPSQGRSLPASTRWRDLANWRQLRPGMTMDEVRALLGEPERVEGGPVTYWRWADANVYFIDGALTGWTEPVVGASVGGGLGGTLGGVDGSLLVQPLYAGIGGVTNPELIQATKVPPRYPDAARKAKISGKVFLQAVVKKDGSVGDIQVLQSPGSKFGVDEAAIAAVKQWRYKPATQEGRPVDVYFEIVVDFEKGQ